MRALAVLVIAVAVLLFPASVRAQDHGSLVLATDPSASTLHLPPAPKKPSRAFPGTTFARSGFVFAMTQSQGDAPALADHAYTIALDARALSYISDDSFSFRQGFGTRLGGGSAGFDGALHLDAAGGSRIVLGEGHGPFLRLGTRALVSGNNAFYHSYIEVPQLQLGYQQLLRPSMHWELAARAGFVLAGRFNVGNMGRRKTGSTFELGGHASLHLAHIKFEASLTRTDVSEREASSPVDDFSLELCSATRLVAICSDLRLLRGQLAIPFAIGASSDAWVSYAGLFIGGGYGR